MNELEKFLCEEVINFAAKNHPNMSWVRDMDLPRLYEMKRLVEKSIKELQPETKNRRVRYEH